MGRERMLAVVLAFLFVAMAPNALANQENVTVSAVLEDAPERGWYSSGDLVSVSAVMSNSGDATSIIVDPSCNEVLRVWGNNQLVFDGTVNCLGQSRGMDIGANSETQFETLVWDLKNDNGEFVPSGDYRVEYFIAGEELSSSVIIHAQTPTDVPEELELIVTATSRTDTHYDSTPSLITVRLLNTLENSIDLDFGECKLIFNDELLDKCGPANINGNEIVTIAQIPINIESGQNNFYISLGDNKLTEVITITGYESETSNDNSAISSQLEAVFNIGQQTQYGDSETFSSEIGILNNGNEDSAISFSNSCLGEIWIVDSSGRVVMDSMEFKECSEINSDYSIAPGESKTLVERNWDFIDKNGCHVAPGIFTIMFEIPELKIFTSKQVNYLGEIGNYCLESAAYIEPTLAGGDNLIMSPVIHNVNNKEITFLSSCTLLTTLVGEGDIIDNWGTHCENASPYTTNSERIELTQENLDLNDLEDGEYSLIVETLSVPRVRSVVSFNWPIIDNVAEEVEQVPEDDDNIESWIISGSWSSTTNDIGTCWLLNTPDNEILTFASAKGPQSWSPSVGATGEYLVNNSESAPECSDFAAQAITIKEVYSQSIPIEDEKEEQVVVAETPVTSSDEEISPTVITIGVAVASTGILSLLVAVIATNESWRIPATSAGLWLLGLVGRTSETSDGRYQRGRLMGYLTANPGCHFRALMAALDMSNGQITHHLKILEDEGRIWRRADGRLVRFYPYTANLHPGILDQDLPMPPLSPDPNSLQGKILKLLDDDGQMNKFPTQAELAHRLDRSQQLVSHHLRTLQKYGLVQKQKSGVKNRYCLTREALFLLDTTEL